MIKKGIARRAIILACAAFFVFSVSAYRVKAETLYALENLITNGDFNDNILSWSYSNATISWENGTNKIIATAKYGWTYQYINVIEDHIYYYSFDYLTDTTNMYFFYQNGADERVLGSTIGDNEWHKYSTIIACVNTGTARLSPRDWRNGDYTPFYFDNVIFIDLTATFGMGFEPSLSDFELLYLPDVEYFQDYSSFIPESVNQVSLSDYVDIGEDLTSVDFTKSVISEYGKNIDLQLYAYFFDPPYGSEYDPIFYDSDVQAQYCRDFYIEYNTPIMRYLDKDYSLSWVGDDESGRVMRLDLSDNEESILKRILFDRTVDFDEQYFTIRAERVYDPFGAGEEYPLDWQIRFYFVLTSTFNMNVNIAQTLISMSIDTDIDEYTSGDWALYGFNTMYFDFFNQYDERFLPALMINNDTRAAQTRMVDNFGTLYTNVKQMRFGWQMTSPNEDIDADAEYIDYSIHELGAFSEQQIIQPIYIDPNSDLVGIDDVFTPAVVEWYDVGGHLKNLFNSVINTVWVKWDLRGLIATFDGIIGKVGDVAALLPAGAWAIVAVVIGASGIGLIFLFVDKAGD